jgi:hypothetical protein
MYFVVPGDKLVCMRMPPLRLHTYLAIDSTRSHGLIKVFARWPPVSFLDLAQLVDGAAGPRSGNDPHNAVVVVIINIKVLQPLWL